MPYRVLIADDEPFIVRGLKKIIPWEELGYTIVGEASEGQATARLLVELKPDILVSDICMPGMSGVEILKLVCVSGLPVKVIFLSGHRDFSFARDAVAYGAVDYLLKPIHVEDLKRALARAAQLAGRERSPLSREVQADQGRHGPQAAAAADPIAGSVPEPRPEDDYSDLLPLREWPYYTAFAFVERVSGAENGQNPPPGKRLVHFAALNFFRRFSGSKEKMVSAEREGIILLVIGHGPEEDPAGVAELASGGSMAELRIAIGAVRGSTVSTVSGIRGSCESALGAAFGSGAESVESRGAESASVGRVIAYINEHYAEPVSLNVAADVACMNPYYFSALFKKRTGVNFKDYLARVRVEAGRKLLLTTGMTGGEIAEAVGLGDARRFSELFRRHFGRNPAEYRAEIKRNIP